MLHKALQACAALVKVLRCTGHMLSGMWTIRRHFGSATQPQRAQHVQQWAQDFLKILEVQLHTSGTPQSQGPLLVVANHISWLDILVMLAVQPVSFVSKSEIKSWPLIGWLATHAGTLYIERASRRDAMRVVHHIADALKPAAPGHAAQMIAVFPEGTTSDGLVVLPFHGNLIQAAISVHAPIQAVALRYIDATTGALNLTPAYVDDDTLVSSVWRLLSSAPVVATVRFAEPEVANGRDRRAWAQHLQQVVQAAVESTPAQ
jgi:1-acyl-sn-glycerol-3-phosphate acyltransferase